MNVQDADYCMCSKEQERVMGVDVLLEVVNCQGPGLWFGEWLRDADYKIKSNQLTK